MKRFLAVLMLIGILSSPAVAAPEYVRQRGIASYVTFGIYNSSTGALITSATGLDSELDFFSDSVAPDGFADATSEATDLGTGVYKLSLTAAEMDSDFVTVLVKSTSTNAVPVVINISTKLGATYDAIAQAVTAGPPSTITLAAADTAATNAYANNTSVVINSATTGAGQTRCIASNVVTTDVATLTTAWDPLPTGTIRYSLLASPNCNGAIVAGGITAASFGSGAIDATAFSQAAADKVWATTTKTLSAAQTFNLTGGITGNLTGNVTGSVGTVAASGITSSSFANDAITAAKVATDVSAEVWSDAAVPFRFIHQANTCADITTGGLNAGDMTPDFSERIAEHVWKIANTEIESSPYGGTLTFQSPYGSIAKTTNNLEVDGSNLNIYRADNSTILETQSITGTVGAAPITGISN